MSDVKQTLLQQQLKTYIKSKGPVSVRAYMEACLYDPMHGYYRQGNPLGADGDFITAPEISQMFGEMLGIWCMTTWQAMAQPVPLQIVELGPGRGTLMADLLRSLSKLHPNFEMLSIHLVERSTTLIEKQKQTLSDHNCPIYWYDSLSEVPHGPSIIIANEFLDCFPIRQFIKTERAWHERVVGLDQNENFTFMIGSEVPRGVIIPSRLHNVPEGSIFEFCPDFEVTMKDVRRLANQHPMAALFIDYGFEGPQIGETLQAVSNHKPVSPFMLPGKVDLTAHVDFTALAALAVANGLRCFGPRDQGAFLSQLGIGARAEILVQNASEAQVEKLASDVVRLVAPEHMGALFKALCLTSPSLEIPPPFDQKVDLQNVPS